MVFSSALFIFAFLPILLVIYNIAGVKYQNGILLIASLFFYAWGEPKNIAVMLLSIMVNYVVGLLIEREGRFKNLLLFLAVVYNVGILFVFKYLNFSVEMVNRIFHSNVEIRKIALPIGISFYTFQIMSYVIDVYRGNVKAQRNIFRLGLYVSLFPQLIAGPIVRYVDVTKQIEKRTTSSAKLYEGVRRFAIGFSKKVLVADQLSPLVDMVFAGTYPSTISNWIAMIAYSLQIYFDFSGYSDMAIGLGKMFGFEFLENFNYPYISQSVQEFWRRWHISLSSWFRDYVYIPLGGSRKGVGRTYLNLIVVFFLTGLWHGASYNFIVWGLYYAFFLIVERMGFRKVLDKMPRFIRHIYSMAIIMFGWIFFRADDLSTAMSFIKGMFLARGDDLIHFNFIMNREYWFVILAGIYFAIPHDGINKWLHMSQLREFIADIFLMLTFMLAICYMLGSGYSPFLYFRF